jgi:hypothetical protein
MCIVLVRLVRITFLITRFYAPFWRQTSTVVVSSFPSFDQDS